MCYLFPPIKRHILHIYNISPPGAPIIVVKTYTVKGKLW